MPDDTVAVADPAISVFSIPEGIPAQDEPVIEAIPDQQEPVEEAAPGTDVLPDAETEPERPDLSALLKGLSDDDLENLPEVKSLVARKGESARQKAERESTAKIEAANQRYLASGEAFNDLQRMIADAANNLDYNGMPVVDRNQVNRLFNLMLDGGAAASVTRIADVLNDVTGEGFELTKAEQDQAAAAQVLWAQNKIDPSPLLRAWLPAVLRAHETKVEGDVRKRVEREVRAEYEAKAKLDTAKAATDQSKSQPGATVVPGGMPGGTTGTEMEQAAASIRSGGREALQRLVPGLTI